MAQKSIKGNEILAKQIKSRRNELNLTIEEAASRAGVGTKTWSRYESGGSIRYDKSRGICKALNWKVLPESDITDNMITVEEYRSHEAWSPFLEDMFGSRAAISFAAGSDILLDQIEQDLECLAALPKGSHIGQLEISWLLDSLPGQFLMYYDYDFLYQMRSILINMRKQARAGVDMVAQSVLEELIIYLCNNEAITLFELCMCPEEAEIMDDEYWIFDLFDDMDLITFLYSDYYLKPDNNYHYSHWSDLQFYVDYKKSH